MTGCNCLATCHYIPSYYTGIERHHLVRQAQRYEQLAQTRSTAKFWPEIKRWSQVWRHTTTLNTLCVFSRSHRSSQLSDK